MMTPAARPVTTEKLTPNQLVMPKKYKMRKTLQRISQRGQKMKYRIVWLERLNWKN